MPRMVIRVCCHISEEKVHLLSSILSELIVRHCHSGKRYLEQVMIVPDGCVEHAISLIFEETVGRSANWKMGPHHTRAVAIPIETDSALHCFVVLEQGLVEQIESDQVPHEAMSYLLEELLHVSFYSVAWQRCGRLYPPSASFSQQELLKIAASLVDEYLVDSCAL